ADLAEAVTALKKWWAATGKVPAQRTEVATDPAAVNSVKGALDSLRGNDPVQRTKAMSLLVERGVAALPGIRDAIKASEKAGDQRSVAVLEDVRWAILVPDEVEERASGSRSALASGKGSERQAAAARLGKAGRLAIPALAELAEDPDPLVVESAVRALS